MRIVIFSHELVQYFNELLFLKNYRAVSHDVIAAILVFQNNETAAMFVYQINPVGVQLFSYVNNSF